MTKSEIDLKQDLTDHIDIHLSAARWRSKNCSVYSTVWDPELYSHYSYLKEFYENQAFTLYIDGLPVAAVVLYGEGEAKYSKKANETFTKKETGKVLYVDDLAVRGELIGKNVFAKLLDKINEYAKTNKYKILRMDTDKKLTALIRCYERNGFSIVSEDYDEHEDRTSVFLERKVV